jgi:hypothetical protein
MSLERANDRYDRQKMAGQRVETFLVWEKEDFVNMQRKK